MKEGPFGEKSGTHVMDKTIKVIIVTVLIAAVGAAIIVR